MFKSSGTNIGYKNKYFRSSSLDLLGLIKSAGAVLYLDTRKATGSGLPTNSPLTDPWVDLVSGSSNIVTPTNFAGTISSGVVTANPNIPYWILDGSDDHFVINPNILNITTAPLAVFGTFAVLTGFSTGYIFSRNTDAASNMQYGIFVEATTNRMSAILEGANKQTSTNNSITANTWYNAGFIWDGSMVNLYINGSKNNTAAGTLSGSLTNRNSTQIGCRRAAAGGISTILKGTIATITVYTGAQCTEANVLKAENALSKSYI
jgi:hypothetical protein